jgi:hypothetical protein
MFASAAFALGFAAGWVSRGTRDSSRSAALAVVAAALDALDRIKRAIAIERDTLEDFVAEARARADALSDERASRNGASKKAGAPANGAAA